jgi:hypothetical protein
MFVRRFSKAQKRYLTSFSPKDHRAQEDNKGKRYLTPFPPEEYEQYREAGEGMVVDQSGATGSQPAQDPAPAQNRTQQPEQQSNVPKDVQDAIDRGEPPNGEYSFLTGKSCPDCKYYPKEVVQAVDAHENQHRNDEHTLSGFFKLFTKNGRRELETRAFKAELAVEERNIKQLETVGPRTVMQERTLTILKNMRD